MMPSNGPESIAQQMANSIQEKVDNVIWEIHKRRRSDSNELPLFTNEADQAAREQYVTENGIYFEMKTKTASD